MKNLGWLFYKNYYDLNSLKLSIERNEKTEEEFFVEKNDAIFNTKFEENDWFEVPSSTKLLLTTTYPGLLSGSGVAHETGKLGELKLGFCFDHTTGLPYLPGSTVKGAIRQVFPNHLRKKAGKVKDSIERQQLLTKADQIERYCIGLFKENVNIDIASTQLLQFEWEVFEGKTIENITEIIKGMSIDFHKMKENPIGVYDSDVFHDACISKSNHKNQFFLDNDFITPHKHPLKSPTPIQFLKVLPNVTWAFQFDLKKTVMDGVTITSQQKVNLFKNILTTLGIGAKTNVGYGQLR